MIEGLPLGTRIKAIDYWCQLAAWRAELEPDNVYGVLDLETVKILDGYKRVEKDWFREPRKDEWFTNDCGMPQKATLTGAGGTDKRRIILEPIKRTRRELVVRYEIEDGHRPDAVFYTTEKTEDLCYPVKSFQIVDTPI